MKILVIGKFSEDQFGFHISDTFKDLGHSTIEFEATLKDKYYKSIAMRRLHQLNQYLSESVTNIAAFQKLRLKRLEKILSENKIDLTITTHDYLFPDEVEFIKKKSNAPIALWFPDSISGFNKAMFIISNFDFLFFKDPYIVLTLNNNYNIQNVFYLPESFNPKYHKTVELTDEDISKYGCDISSFGSPHALRIKLFSQLNDYKIKIWGHHLPIWVNDRSLKNFFIEEYVTNNEKAKSVLSAKINLNTLVPGEIIGLNARTFEIAGIGGFQMLHWRSGLNQLFEEEREVISFNNFSEMNDKIQFYLAHDKERTDIAQAGYMRAHKDHTCKKRIELLINTIFGSEKGFEIPQVEYKF